MGWRYTADLTNLYRAVNFSGDIVQTRLRNSVMQFYLGFLFEPKKLMRATAKGSKAAVRNSGRLVVDAAKLALVTTPKLVPRH